jgi:glycosyltransferase involved in cell wall biosynthesis
MITRWNTFPGIKYFSHGHDKMKQLKNISIKTFFHKSQITNYYEKNILIARYKKCNNKLIAISKDTEEYYKSVFPPELKKGIFLLHNAIDYNRFKSFPRSRNDTTNHIVSLISIGSLIGIKNQLFLLDVVKILKRENSLNFKLTIIGEGVLRNTLEKYISDNDLADIVCLPGIIDNVEDHLKKSDIYIYSCKNEGFGLTIIEAMAAGLPVVCLDGKGNRDIIEDGKNGFMIYENNPEIFAEKIIELIQSKELYESMSKYAIEFAKKYDIKEYVDKLLKIYNEA